MLSMVEVLTRSREFLDTPQDGTSSHMLLGSSRLSELVSQCHL